MKTIYIGLACVLLLSGGLVWTGCEREATRRTAVQEQDDQKITENVKQTLVNSPTYKFPDVQIMTYKGKVQLSGFVLTSEQKEAAERLAKSAEGVIEVENKISIKP